MAPSHPGRSRVRGIGEGDILALPALPAHDQTEDMIGMNDTRDVRRLLEELEQEPDVDHRRLVDRRELEQAGAVLQDPELMVTLQGGMDDPDGLDTAPRVHRAEDELGWDLSAPLVVSAESDPAEQQPVTRAVSRGRAPSRGAAPNRRGAHARGGRRLAQ